MYKALAKRLWKFEWISGDGPYAVMARCRKLTVTLHKTLDEAIRAKDFIDDLGCCGACVKDHDIKKIDRNAQLTRETGKPQGMARSILWELNNKRIQ